MSSSNELNLLTLLPDIIRKVINVGLEDVDTMRTISPGWYKLVEEHLSNKKNLPLIKKVILSVDCVEEYHDDSYEVTKLSVHISERLREYFGLKDWENHGIVSESNRNLFVLSFNSFSSHSKVLEKLSKRLTRMFSRCAGIRRLDLSKTILNYTSEEGVIISAINGLEINTLFFKGRFKLESELEISQVLRANKVGRFVLITSPFKESNTVFDALVAFTVNLSRLVAVVELSSHDPDEEVPMKNLLRDLTMESVAVRNGMQKLRDISENLRKLRADMSRIEWSNFVNIFSQSEKLTATLQEEYLPNGRLRCYITITAKS